MKKKIFITSLAAFITIYTVPSTVLAATPKNYIFESKDSVSEQSARQDEIGYQYRVFNNVLYQRLFNFTKNKPLSDWEIVS